ncbi:hypothetical protein [Brachybacterium sp. GPGPB12]
MQGELAPARTAEPVGQGQLGALGTREILGDGPRLLLLVVL